MCCKRRAAQRAARRNGGAIVIQQRRKTLIRMIIENFIEKREHNRAMRQSMDYGTAFERSQPRAMEEGRVVDVERVTEERDSWDSEEWELIDEKKQLQMLDQRYPMREPSQGTELPSYEAANGRV